MIAELNLLSPGQGVPYSKIKYPDGQVSIKINFEMMDVGSAREHPPEAILIKARMNNYDDLFYILAATDALKNWGVGQIDLFVSCFLGQRSDRRFFDGQSFDLKIIANIVKSQHYHRITLFHPHSDVLAALLDPDDTGKVITIDMKQYVQLALADIEAKHGVQAKLVSPDPGAFKWVFKMAGKLGRAVVSANKSRDGFTDVITTDVQADVKGKICLIVDDYCDGGRTFVQLAELLIVQGAAAVYLVTAHGLYSNGIGDVEDRDHPGTFIAGLNKFIGHAYTTNSISDEQNDFVTRFKII